MSDEVEPLPSPHGEVITFYSYKGGTGRSMALANIACYLARTAKVLAVDWDLDSPGLSQYFRPILSTQESRPGVLEFFEDWIRKTEGQDVAEERYSELLTSTDFHKYT